MYFEFVRDALVPGDPSRSFGAAEELYNYCSEAEKNCRIDPDKAVISVRQALEVLASALLCEYGKTQFTRNDSLDQMLTECKSVCRNSIRDEAIDTLHTLRAKANKYVHIERKVNAPTVYSIRGRHATIKAASKYTVMLYKALSEIFGNPSQYIDYDFLPIGDYIILDKYKKAPYEACGEYKYYAEKKGSITSTYAYIRPFSNVRGDRNSVFNERDIAAQEVFKNIPKSKYIITGEEIPVSTYCDVRYIKYTVRRDTRTLDRVVKDLKPRDVLKILSDVSQGLSEIKVDGINIHHRNIRPTCIFVNKDGNTYSGQLGCFETAKIEIPNVPVETVHVNVLQANKGSIFIHPQLREPGDKTSTEWEKGDVYSLAAVLMYCMNPDYVSEGNYDTDSIAENFSEDFSDEIINILRMGSLEVVPGIGEFHKMLEEELKNGIDQ